jgi:hypothetical protein
VSPPVCVVSWRFPAAHFELTYIPDTVGELN